MREVYKVQTVKKTYPAAAEAVARILIHMDCEIDSLNNTARKIVEALGFKSD